MKVIHPLYGPYHARDDGTIPCTNACGKDIVWSPFQSWWLHTDGWAACDVTPYEGQEACPEEPGEYE